MNPEPIDLDVLQQAMPTEVNYAELVRPNGQSIVQSTHDLVHLKKFYEETIPARITRWFTDGEAIIALLAIPAMASVVVAVFVAIAFVESVMAVVSLVTVTAPVILTVALAALLGILLCGRRSGTNTVVVKGCPKGPTPGPVRIQR